MSNIAVNNLCLSCQHQLVDFGERDPLYKSSSRGCLSCVRWLIDDRGNINRGTDWSDETALHTAAREGHVKVVEYLLEKKAAIEQKNCYGNAALYIASCQARLPWYNDGNMEPNRYHIVRMLLDHGAQFSTNDNIIPELFALGIARQNCKQSILTFIGVRRKLEFDSCRDTHTMIAMILWQTRFEKNWVDQTTGKKLHQSLDFAENSTSTIQ